ncbi:MAG: FAD-dependent thymidylate synthase [Patescibacteria group bacterium]
MKLVEPRSFLLAATQLDRGSASEYLEFVGAPEWMTDAPSDSEELVEMMGRLCYKSFAPGLNPNVTKVREGSKEYLEHIIHVGHGSVIEHAMFTFVFANVSRVFTHELVRHRAGTAISQESLRFVRLDEIGFWIPSILKEKPEGVELILEHVRQGEELQRKLAGIYELDKPGTKFDYKKKVTSALRRAAPDGLATAIGWSANLRALRHCIEMRTDPNAEEEIRVVFGKVAATMQERCPNVFGDYEIEIADGLPWYKTSHRKV